MTLTLGRLPSSSLAYNDVRRHHHSIQYKPTHESIRGNNLVGEFAKSMQELPVTLDCGVSASDLSARAETNLSIVRAMVLLHEAKGLSIGDLAELTRDVVVDDALLPLDDTYLQTLVLRTLQDFVTV